MTLAVMAKFRDNNSMFYTQGSSVN